MTGADAGTRPPGTAAAPMPLADLAGRWLTPEHEQDFALPTVVNFHGLLQVAWGPTGIQNWTVPPTGLPTPTAILYCLDDAGRPTRPDPRGTRYRWHPWQVERQHPVVDATTVLHPHDSAVTERLTVHRSGRYLLVVGGLCRTWSFTDYWNLPPDDVPQLNVRWDGEAVLVQDCKTFAAARFIPSGRPVAVRTHLGLDDLHAGREVAGGADGAPGRLVALELELTAGETFSWTAVQGTDPRAVPTTTADAARGHWEEVWEAAFTPGNAHFTGHLPALDLGDPDLDRLYAMSVLTLLNSRRLTPQAPPRARFATGGQAIWAGDVAPLPVAYTWGGSEGAPTTSFLWEVQVQAALLARLDPVVLRGQLEAFLRADMGSHWGIDVLTGRGVGMWYGVNDGAIVTSAADYLRVTGDLAWLDAVVAGRTVREHLLRHVGRHAELADGQALADFGSAQNILECVSTYEHRIAAFNAQAAWCHRFAAAVLEPGRAQEHLDAAERIEDAVRALMNDDGTFRCLTPDGERTVRTCLDFIYVGRFMAERLGEEQRSAMLRFFTEELETTDWMFALSPRDADALTPELPTFQTYRADHQATGSYDGWPGLAAAVRLAFGDREATLDWLRRISATTWEGPFGQAHYVGLSEADRHAPASKASFFNGNCYLEACGCTLATTLLEMVAAPS